MEKNALLKYAQVLLQKGVNLQKNQILVINAPVESSSFVTLLTEEAYRSGASQVVIRWRSDDITRLRYLHETEDKFATFPAWQQDFSLFYYRKKAAFLSLVSANPSLMKDVDANKIIAWQKAQYAALQEYIDGMMASKVTWLVAAVPGTVWNHMLYPDQSPTAAEDALWNIILKCARANGENPLADWDVHLEKLKERREWLTAQQFQSLHYQSSNGTDLIISLPEHHLWQGGSEEAAGNIAFNANIPTEEVYTAPLRTAVDGIVYNTKPLVYNGSVIDNFSITFKQGKAVAVHAEKGEAILKKMIGMDEGAAYLGEVSLVPYHSPISMSGLLFYETLFDENASCHLAFGKAYPTCITNGADLSAADALAAGLNDSMIHVDFMVGTADLQIVGKKKDNTEVTVFENGDFAK